jgi:general secretion pathway protein D
MSSLAVLRPMLAALAVWVGLSAYAQTPLPPATGFGNPPSPPRGAAPTPNASASTAGLKFNNSPLSIILEDYSEKTGRTLLIAPGLPQPTITLRSQGDLSMPEYLQAIETVLTMHQIGLVPVGKNFLKVVPIKTALRTGVEIRETPLKTMTGASSGELISQMIVLRHIDSVEATKTIEPLRNEFGQINALERTNSILVTDTADNVNRMLQILRYVDQPPEIREEPNIIEIRHAKATEIKQKLEEIIAETLEKQKQSTVPRPSSTGSPGTITRAPTSIPGVIRARVPTPNTPDPTPAVIETLMADADRGVIRGSVKIVADERTDLLIIITRPENMRFFEKIIAVLDVETGPDVVVKVIRLEFADADEVAGMLNTLIGATSKDAADTTPGKSADNKDEPRGIALRDIAAARKTAAEKSAAQKSKVGELSTENVKILADKRTNALIIMASKNDLLAIVEIVKDMDMMLSQVLIEAVIIDVSLDDTLDTGVNWIQKALVSYETDSRTGRRTPLMAFAGGGGGSLSKGGTARDAIGLNNPADLATSGLGYFFTIFDLNMNAVLKASASDTRTRVVSTPVLLTTDNKEAKLSSTEKIYVFEGTTFYDNSANSSARYSQADVGLELTVTPHINDNHVVMMDIKQKISEPGDATGQATDSLAGTRISIDRSIEASIAVQSGQTIVLGGQVRDASGRSRTKIPLLGSIPLLGRLFNSDSRSKGRTETIVFITPYVLDTPEAVEQETRRRRDSLNIEGMWKSGWSGSELAEKDKKQRAGKPRPPARQPITWSTSSGKTARGFSGEEPSLNLGQPEPKSDDDQDIDRFIESQESRWNDAMQRARVPPKTP